jgi:putative transcriptional regulator
MITFKPLWETLGKKNITTYDLIHHYKMSKGMLDNLKHDRSITLRTLNDLCEMFECDIKDIIEYTKDK